MHLFPDRARVLHGNQGDQAMAKVLVLYYSSYGHMEQMANAAAEGARQTGAEAIVKRVPELVPEEIARKSRISSSISQRPLRP